MLNTFLSSRKEVIPSSFPVNHFILEQELRTSTMYPIEKKLYTKCTPIENWKTPFRNSGLAALNQIDQS
jgi:hypothetical protein